MFDLDWLEEVDEDYQKLVLNVSKEDFHWIQFTSEHT
jgi:hypothetical protein